MRRRTSIGATLGLVCIMALAARAAQDQSPQQNKPQWAMNATIMACQTVMTTQNTVVISIPSAQNTKRI